MTIIIDYASLIQSVQDVTEDDSAELVNYIPTAIDLAEEHLFKELDIPDLESKVTGTLTTSSNVLAKPTGYRYANYFKIKNGVKNLILKKRREDYVVDYWPDETQTATPKYYADLSSTQFKLAPTPDTNYSYEIKYPIQPNKLSNSNVTNYFTANCKLVLYYATMVEMVIFMKAWSQVPVWEQLYTQARDEWNIQVARSRRDDGEKPMNTQGGPNTLKNMAESAS